MKEEYVYAHEFEQYVKDWVQQTIDMLSPQQLMVGCVVLDAAAKLGVEKQWPPEN